MDPDPSSGAARPDFDGVATPDQRERCVGGSYLLIRPIGQGATGTVWRGVDRATGEPVAVKLLHESLLRQPKLVTRFVQERTILLMLRHRNVVRVRDLFSVGESLGLVMDLVPGGSLRDYLREHHTLRPGAAAGLAAQVAAALAEAHDLGVVHRDLKPDNILLHVEDGRLDPRLTDFGIARVLHTPRLTTTNAVVGTPHYMSPEAFHSSAAGPATDVYALGVLLYELLCGRPPYDSDSVADLMRLHLAGDPERRPGIPDRLWQIVTGCLEQRPGLRPTAAELVAELSDAARTAPALPPPGKPLAVPPPHSAPPARLPRHVESPEQPRHAEGLEQSRRVEGSDRLRHAEELEAPRRADGSDPLRRGEGLEEPRRAEGAGRLRSGKPSVGEPQGAARPAASVVPGLPVPRRRNQVGAWRWSGPRAMITLVSAAMLASGVATTAWHLGRAGGDPRDQPAAQAPFSAAPPSASAAAVPQPAAPSVTPSADPTTAGRRIAPPAARAPRTSRPAARKPAKSPLPEARTYGPDDCRRSFALMSFDNPIMVEPCQALGARVRFRASISARPGGTGALSVGLRDAGTGRAVGSPLTCGDLVFAEGATTRGCGPATAAPARGRRYQVVVTWTVTRDGRTATSTVRGDEFGW